MIHLSRDISKGPKGCIYIIRRKSSYQKVHKYFKRMNCLESYIQKVDLQKANSQEIPHPQNFFCMIHGSFLKVKLDKTRSKRSADNFEKLGNLNGQFSLLVMFLLVEKESNLFLFPVLDQWIKKLQAQYLKSQCLDFEAYISLEDYEEEVSQLVKHSAHLNIFQDLIFSTF